MQIPFIYGRPVRRGEFLGRKNELDTIFNRLRNGESSAVVGESHIGKTSLLLQLMDRDVQNHYFGSSSNYFYSFIDLHIISSDFNPKEFWKLAIEPLIEGQQNLSIEQRVMDVIKDNYGQLSLEKLFKSLHQEHCQLILVLDEFDRLLHHPSFSDAIFFAQLRSFSTRVGGLAFVTATRLSVAELDKRGRGLLDIGSPFFNSVIQLTLKPFSDQEMMTLLSKANNMLSSIEKKFIIRVSGRHPYLLQAMGAIMCECTGENRFINAAESFYDKVSFHFDDLWYSMDDKTRTTAIILSMVDFEGRVLGQEYSYGEIEKVDAFGPELKKLAIYGLAEKVGDGWQLDRNSSLLWRGERWVLGSKAFSWWIRDVVIADSRNFSSYTEWLNKKRYRLLLTQEMWDKVNQTISSMPGWAVKGISAMAKPILDELLNYGK